MVYKSVDNGKLQSICFFTITDLFLSRWLANFYDQ